MTMQLPLQKNCLASALLLKKLSLLQPLTFPSRSVLGRRETFFFSPPSFGDVKLFLISNI